MAGRGRCATGLLAAAAVLLAAPAAAAASPRAEAALQRDARVLAKTTAELYQAIDSWRRQGKPAVGPPPRAVERAALYQQRLVIRLSADPPRVEKVVARMYGRIRARVQAIVRARLVLLELGLPHPRPLRSFRPGTPRPAGVLLEHYRDAERRFGVGWHILAAVNFVESGFGRIRSPSSAGALGPMQFMPPTWEAYGLGGNIFRPRDAIMAAANYLRASGAPRDYWGALYHYNHSDSYVEAVLRYAALMKRDIRAFYSLYSWQVFVRTPSGLRRLAGPPRRPEAKRAKCCPRRAPGAREQKSTGSPPVLVVPLRAVARGAPPARASASPDSAPEVRARANGRSLYPGQASPAGGDRPTVPLRGRPQCCSRPAGSERTRQARAPPGGEGSVTLPSV
jgi:hypothetical protein